MSGESQLRHAQKVLLDRELKDKTGLSVSQMRQKASFQQRIEMLQTARLAKAATQVAAPRVPITVSETKLEPKTIVEGVHAKPPGDAAKETMKEGIPTPVRAVVVVLGIPTASTLYVLVS